MHESDEKEEATMKTYFALIASLVLGCAGKKKLKDLRVGDKPNGLALKE